MKVAKVILQADGDLALQAKAAAYALSLGRPEGNPAIHCISIGDRHVGVYWNKQSITTWPQDKPRALAEGGE